MRKKNQLAAAFCRIHRTVVLIAVTALYVCAQSAIVTADQNFEVVSIKPAPRVREIVTAGHGVLEAKGASLRKLIGVAYNVQTYQVSGGPPWVGSDGFDLVAKARASSTREQLGMMLRATLAERCNLVIHHEALERKVYALTVLPDGLKLDEYQGDIEAPVRMEPRHLHWRIGMDEFAGRLSQLLRAPIFDRASRTSLSAARALPVVNETGLGGIYDIVLQFPPKLQDDVFSTWQVELRSLGLALAAKRTELDTVVVDRLDRPTPN